MSPDKVPQPDLALEILPEYGGQSTLKSGYAAGAPEFIVEVSVTTAAKDAGAKMRLYERSFVREYLIVRPKERQLTWNELVDGKYREITAEAYASLQSRVFPGLWLNPEALWNNDLSALAATVQRGVTSPEHAAFLQRLKPSTR